MKCPKKFQDFNKKPKDTVDKIYVWKELKNNPNTYCWAPVSKHQGVKQNYDLSKIKLYSIPEPVNFEEKIDTVSDYADKYITHELTKKFNEGIDMVSVDDSKKYKIVEKFVKKKKLKIYGGIAINAFLPKKYKIYENNTIPDYDIYSPNAWKDAVELANILYKSGYKYTEVRSGIHPGTYKVFSNFWPVADITYLPKNLYNSLKTKKQKGINYVSPIRLMEQFYKELSKPVTNPLRWPKIVTRQKLFEKWSHPLPKNLKCSKDIFTKGDTESIPKQISELLEITASYIHDKKLIHYGALAYNTYMEIGGAIQRLQVHSYHVFSEIAQIDIQNLVQLLNLIDDNIYVETDVQFQNEIYKTKYTILTIIDNKTYKIVEIANLDYCIPYKYLLGRYVISIDLLYYMLYNELSFDTSRKNERDIMCKILYLNKVQNLYYKVKKQTEFDFGPFQRFVIHCRGPIVNTIKQELLNRWEKRLNKTKGKEDECKNKKEDDCEDPCTWNDKNKLCTRIPDGVYRVN